ncbi:MAG TPA: hypothetical protein DDW23_08600 [Planctomycetes bacterium]|nr:hypothetical protein [Planctomycetota bacterium]
MKAPSSYLPLLILAATSCQSSPSLEFETGLIRTSFGGGFSSAEKTDKVMDTEFSTVTAMNIDMTAGIFMAEDVEIGGSLTYTSTEENFADVGSADETESNLDLGLYGRYYFGDSRGARQWLHIGLGTARTNEDTTSEDGFNTNFGVGHTHFITDSAAIELGAFYGLSSVGDYDNSSVDLAAAYSIFW